MARGHQKVQSQQKNLEKQQGQKKGTSKKDSQSAAAKALIYSCTICKVTGSNLHVHYPN